MSVRSRLKVISLLAATLFLITGFQNCSGVDFGKGAESSTTASKTEDDLNAGQDDLSIDQNSEFTLNVEEHAGDFDWLRSECGFSVPFAQPYQQSPGLFGMRVVDHAFGESRTYISEFGFLTILDAGRLLVRSFNGRLRASAIKAEVQDLRGALCLKSLSATVRGLRGAFRISGNERQRSLVSNVTEVSGLGEIVHANVNLIERMNGTLHLMESSVHEIRHFDGIIVIKNGRYPTIFYSVSGKVFIDGNSVPPLLDSSVTAEVYLNGERIR